MLTCHQSNYDVARSIFESKLHRGFDFQKFSHSCMQLSVAESCSAVCDVPTPLIPCGRQKSRGRLASRKNQPKQS